MARIRVRERLKDNSVENAKTGLAVSKYAAGVVNIMQTAEKHARCNIDGANIDRKCGLP